MRRVALFTACGLTLLLVLQSQFAPAQQAAPANTLAGCLTGEPGNYTLGALPSGNLYRLQGNIAALAGYDHQLIRITGSETAPASSTQMGTFNVQNVQVISDSCTSPLPPQTAQGDRPVTGKTASESTAINTSTTESVTRTTPGYQTEAGETQQPGKHAAVAPGEENLPARRGPLAPPVWGQAGQAPQEGNINAAAARQAEQQPGHTLGVNAMPAYANPNQPEGQQRRRAAPVRE